MEGVFKVKKSLLSIVFLCESRLTLTFQNGLRSLRYLCNGKESFLAKNEILPEDLKLPMCNHSNLSKKRPAKGSQALFYTLFAIDLSLRVSNQEFVTASFLCHKKYDKNKNPIGRRRVRTIGSNNPLATIEKKAPAKSKNNPAYAHSFNRLRPGMSTTIDPAILAMPMKGIKYLGYPKPVISSTASGDIITFDTAEKIINAAKSPVTTQ